MAKYLKPLLLLMAMMVGLGMQGQDTTTTFYNGLWENVDRGEAHYVRKAWMEDGLWMLRDYYKDGGLQMIGSLSSLDPEVYQGKFVYYNEAGNKTSEGRYVNNSKTGLWTTWYDDGTLNTIGRYQESTATGIQTEPISTGEWEYFYRNGNRSSKVIFEESAPIQIEYWNEDGTKSTDEPVWERMPEFPGGPDSLMYFLGRNIHYPDVDLAERISGEVVIKFTIDENGKVVDPIIARSVSPTIDAETMRVVKSMPDWIPGFQNNRPVKVEYNLPIRFRPRPENNKKKQNKRR